MNSREILEAFRKGQINEKTIARFLFLLSERCDTNERNLVMMAREIEKLQNILMSQISVSEGLKKYYEGVAKQLGLDTNTLGKVNSESVENRPHLVGLPGDE